MSFFSDNKYKKGPAMFSISLQEKIQKAAEKGEYVSHDGKTVYCNECKGTGKISVNYTHGGAQKMGCEWSSHDCNNCRGIGLLKK